MAFGAYPWLLWLHIFASLVFFFIHGTALAIAFRLPEEETLDGMRSLLNITGMTLPYLFGSFLLLQAFGIALAFMAEWWKQAWPWLSFILLNGMTIWMTWYGRQVYSPLRRALGMPYMTGFSKEKKPVEPASMEVIRALIDKSNPRMLTWVGGIISGLILWLMTLSHFRKTNRHRLDAGLFVYPIFFFIESFNATLYTLSNFPINSLACAPPWPD